MSPRRPTILSLVFACIFISIIVNDTVRCRKAQILQTQWVVFFNLFSLISHFTCISTNVICRITCTLCQKIYIGETGKRLADRFREHLREKNKTKQNKQKNKKTKKKTQMRPSQSRAILIFPISLIDPAPQFL